MLYTSSLKEEFGHKGNWFREDKSHREELYTDYLLVHRWLSHEQALPCWHACSDFLNPPPPHWPPPAWLSSHNCSNPEKALASKPTIFIASISILNLKQVIDVGLQSRDCWFRRSGHVMARKQLCLKVGRRG